jgi:hypothetical protein
VEAALTAPYLLREYQKQVGRQRYFQCEYQMQSRRLHNQRRAYQRQLQRQRDCYERQARAATEANRDALYSPTVARLLAVAVCSESDGEAKAAFTKARMLYRIRALSHAPSAGWDEGHKAGEMHQPHLP